MVYLFVGADSLLKRYAVLIWINLCNCFCLFKLFCQQRKQRALENYLLNSFASASVPFTFVSQTEGKLLYVVFPAIYVCDTVNCYRRNKYTNSEA